MAVFSANAERRRLTYSVKQMLAREIEMEKMRQLEAANFGPVLPVVAPQPEKKVLPPVAPVAVEAPLPNHLQFLKPKAVAEATKVSGFQSNFKCY